MDDCIRYRERLHEWVDGELEDTFCEEVDKHVTHCPSCADAAKGVEHIKLLLKTKARRPRVPADLESRVRQSITVERGRPQLTARWSGRKIIPFASVAALLFLLFSSSNIFFPSQNQDLHAMVMSHVFDSHLRSINGEADPEWRFDSPEKVGAFMATEMGQPVKLFDLEKLQACTGSKAVLQGVSFEKCGDLRLAKVFYLLGTENLSFFVCPVSPGPRDGLQCCMEGRNLAVFCCPGESICYYFGTSRQPESFQK
ncbi:MAG: zf-HC2 domain-containing protein, partial [Planctomycetota bacterium]